MKKWKKLIVESTLIFLISSITALIFNSINPKGIPLVAKYQYEIYSDCAEFTEEAEFISITRAFSRINDENTVFVDTRKEEEYKKEHIKEAINIPYDVLFPVSDQSIAQIKNKDLIIVYDDKDDKSEYREAKELAKELKSAGIKQVRYMKQSFSDWKNKGFQVSR